MTPTSRKMRRMREVATSNSNDEDLLSGFDLYEIQGDSKAALDAFLGNLKEEGGKPTLTNDYNVMVLRKLSGTTDACGVDFLQYLDNFESTIATKTYDQISSDRERKRNEFIMAYNRALIFQASGQLTNSISICTEKLQDFIESKQKPPDQIAPVAARMSLILLECMLAVAVGRNSGFGHELFKSPAPADILDWLESLDVIEQEPQLKFLLALYKSRVDLAHLEGGKHVDSKIRSARKELKTAMEVFQHKLRPTFGAETASVVSSANSEENVSTQQQHHQVSNHHHHEHQQQPPPSSVVLQKYSQSALSLKANLEQLKGNTKKSLILCSEAQAATKDDGSYDAVHSNNHAVVYETNNKRQLALHALTKALRASSNYRQKSENVSAPLFFHKDGTSRPDPTLEILHNAAICALQARNYTSAYECMAICVSRSVVFQSRPRCWLRMAEACLGIFSELRKKQQKSARLATVEINGTPHGIVIDSSLLSDDVDVRREKLVADLGSAADFEQVRRTPLLRARATLEHVIRQDGIANEPEILTSARLSLAYVSLAFRDYRLALEISQLVLEEEKKDSERNFDDVTRCLCHKRQMATARMYAAEASCALGELVDSMKYLVGDGKEDAFDRLASDLGGVTLETAAGNGKGKRRLAKAQTMVRSSACAVTAAMGNTQAAKQLANSANAMEDAYASNRERSSARRALIYALLRDGHQSPALNLLLSLR